MVTGSMIHIFINPRYKIDKKSITQKTADILAANGISSENILNIAFIGKRKMKDIARTYKNENVALPVLSFSYKTDRTDTSYKSNFPSEESTFGEIVICYPQAVLLAAQKNRTVEQTLMKLIEHGVGNILYK